MAYKCIKSTRAGRRFEVGEIYDSIGRAHPPCFEEIDADDAQVIETGLAPVEDLERESVKEELRELDVSFNGRSKTETLKDLLLEARQASLLA